VPSLILQMKVERADEWARREYEIYCAVWQTQGHVKSAAFVRGVCSHIVQMLGVRANSIAHEFSRFARRTSFPGSLTTAHLRGLDLRMRQLQGRWQRRLEIEAKECEHAERRARLARQTLQSGAATTKVPTGALAEANRQPPAAETRKAVCVPRNGPNIKRPGRPPKLVRPFVICAGTLWRNATSDSHSNVPVDKLRQIASALDAAGYVPPSTYLERTYATELKAFNSRNSNSKSGPIMTWSELISYGDKDHVKGMRRLLYRCAEKLDDGHPLSGN